MKELLIYQLQTMYRDDMKIRGYEFGQGNHTACIVGAMRGNEIQQIYSCGLLVKELTALEKHIKKNHSILVIPCVNNYSVNIGKRFWPIDNTDINRMFPGSSVGETTQRIAAGLFDAIKDYDYGIQFTSFYISRDFYPHVRVLKTGYEDIDIAGLFGLPYVYLRDARPFDTTTLNYNWQIWNTKAFSVYTNSMEQINEQGANQCVKGILRLLSRLGIINYNSDKGEKSTIIQESDITIVKNNFAGIIKNVCEPGSKVTKGQLIAQVINPCNAQIIEELEAPTDGVIFSAHGNSLANSQALAFEIIR
ncbi:MAG: M14 family metallopeptidase [Lachnospiraceae bacterium]